MSTQMHPAKGKEVQEPHVGCTSPNSSKVTGKEKEHHRDTIYDIRTFTVQCAACNKWRLIPIKEKYEEIRENISHERFVSESAREWRPDISCDDPADIIRDGSKLWALDKPNIPQDPPDWKRLYRIRGEGSSRFADVYYLTHWATEGEGIFRARNPKDALPLKWILEARDYSTAN